MPWVCHLALAAAPGVQAPCPAADVTGTAGHLSFVQFKRMPTVRSLARKKLKAAVKKIVFMKSSEDLEITVGETQLTYKERFEKGHKVAFLMMLGLVQTSLHWALLTTCAPCDFVENKERNFYRKLSKKLHQLELKACRKPPRMRKQIWQGVSRLLRLSVESMCSPANKCGNLSRDLSGDFQPECLASYTLCDVLRKELKALKFWLVWGITVSLKELLPVLRSPSLHRCLLAVFSIPAEMVTGCDGASRQSIWKEKAESPMAPVCVSGSVAAAMILVFQLLARGRADGKCAARLIMKGDLCITET
ncbi:hypothetical protein Anapl_00078 [Anas platyrhynchos]|uniref:Uncharacterized protein n=1 Tax=Anas platyrhynchos TaxID=8839 RepID=R0K1E2_ANAPL|nr:hypothetical protein Anapl_00078 [Anas platyrhynchos]